MYYLPVLTKNDFVKRFIANEFGNRGPMWNSLDEFTKSGYRGLVHLRNRVAGAFTLYNVPSVLVVEEFEKAVRLHGDTFYLAGMAPTEQTLIQGEAMLTEKGLYFYGSYIKRPMREALGTESFQAIGIHAHMLIKNYMDVDSWYWFNDLLKNYPNHVIEFSVYGVNWGTIPNRNTVFWEVRGAY